MISIYITNINKRAYSLHIVFSNQIGNCLRLITSGIIIAKYYNLYVFIDINRSSIHSEKEKTIVSKLFSDYIDKDTDSSSFKKVKIEEISSNTNYNLIKEGNASIDGTNLRLDGIYSSIPGNMSINEYIRNKIAIYKSLPYPSLLIDTVNSFSKKHNLHDCIGIHIRYTDNLNDKAKVVLNTSLDTFLTKVKTYKNERLFICSDSKTVLSHKNIIKNENGNTIIFADTYSDNTYQALYEMMLLSNTKRIIGSSSSTFSYESAFIKGTDIELYENNKWILYDISSYNV